MNTLAWILQVVLALMFGMAGVMKTTQPREKLVKNLAWVNDFSDTQVKMIGSLELLAAIGLILPAVTGVLSWLTPLAATGLVLLMAGASYTHYRRQEVPFIGFTGTLLLLAGVVAYLRFFVETL